MFPHLRLDFTISRLSNYSSSGTKLPTSTRKEKNYIAFTIPFGFNGAYAKAKPSRLTTNFSKRRLTDTISIFRDPDIE